jgi:hypothetical protein
MESGKLELDAPAIIEPEHSYMGIFMQEGSHARKQG